MPTTPATAGPVAVPIRTLVASPPGRRNWRISSRRTWTFACDRWGDSGYTAARLESDEIPSEIQILRSRARS